MLVVHILSLQYTCAMYIRTYTVHVHVCIIHTCILIIMYYYRSGLLITLIACIYF